MLNEGDGAPAFSIRPIFGYEICVPAEESAGLLVLTFVGSLASPFTRRWLFALQDHFADFDRVGARVAAVAACAVADAQDFVPRYHLLYPLAAEPTGAIAERYAVQRDRTLLRSIRRGLLQNARSALAYGVGWGSGSVRTLPAVFVIDPAGDVRWCQYAQSISDVPDIEALLLCVSSS